MAAIEALAPGVDVNAEQHTRAQSHGKSGIPPGKVSGGRGDIHERRRPHHARDAVFRWIVSGNVKTLIERSSSRAGENNVYVNRITTSDGETPERIGGPATAVPR
jgi:hypothetical protein